MDWKAAVPQPSVTCLQTGCRSYLKWAECKQKQNSKRVVDATVQKRQLVVRNNEINAKFWVQSPSEEEEVMDGENGKNKKVKWCVENEVNECEVDWLWWGIDETNREVTCDSNETRRSK